MMDAGWAPDDERALCTSQYVRKSQTPEKGFHARLDPDYRTALDLLRVQ
eukprot:CAMPEP_0185208730 /NCGR_PEP_ID=MMETSP1140-20130426/62517_1 /TAXON_ID=298111 /ORGANISM="Pavlova sp., Strain CCMP459" /LENGTH=48 /DNA_ID= /DNA_START= /DNA_END= /DNA_ORIENTATION=